MDTKQKVVIKFNWKKDWKLLFTRNKELFIYKRAWVADVEICKPLRIDWVIKYLFWQVITSLYMIIGKPLFRLDQHFRVVEGEELTLTGRQLEITPIKRFKLWITNR